MRLNEYHSFTSRSISKGRWLALLSDQDKEEPKIDPRWEKLNDFKLDDD